MSKIKNRLQNTGVGLALVPFAIAGLPFAAGATAVVGGVTAVNIAAAPAAQANPCQPGYNPIYVGNGYACGKVRYKASASAIGTRSWGWW